MTRPEFGMVSPEPTPMTRPEFGMVSPEPGRSSVWCPPNLRAVAAIDALGNTNSTVFDAASRPIATVNPLGFRSSSVYDNASRLIAAVNPLGFRISFGYDAAGGQVSVTDALGNINTTVFDADRRTLATINANGFATTQVFDAVGQLLAVIDARGNRNSFTYDGAGRQVLSTDALANTVTSQFDAASRQTVRIDGRGLRTSYAYDAASRLVGQQYQDGTRLTNTYDANSQRTVLSDWTGAYSSSFDPVGRLGSVVNPAGIAITYGYDAASQRAWMNQPTGLFTYSHDPAGRMANLVNPEGQTTSWQYDAASRVTATVMANGTLASNTYDSADQLLLLANLKSGGTTLSSFHYTYNPVGNRTQVVEANGDVLSLSYDSTYQLTNEMRSGANAYNISYTYDPVGSRTLLLNSGAPTTSTYNAGNELVTSQNSAGVTTSTYDGGGNLLTSMAPGNQWTTNTWDGENRLTRVALPSGIVNSFIYNGDSQRIQKQDSTGTTNHVWDSQNILLETNANNVIQVVYALEPMEFGNLLSQTRNGIVSFYLFDPQGSTRQLAEVSGTVTDDYLYDSWGNVLIADGGTTNPFRYIGREGYYLDLDSQTYCIRRRYYLPLIARFASVDPIIPVLENGPTGRSFSLYTYILNRAPNLTDPSGLTPLGGGQPVLKGSDRCKALLQPFYNQVCQDFQANSGLFDTSKGWAKCVSNFCKGTGITLKVVCPSEKKPGWVPCGDVCAATVGWPFYVTYFCPAMGTKNCGIPCGIFHELVHACGVAREGRTQSCTELLYPNSQCDGVGVVDNPVIPNPANCPDRKRSTRRCYS
jgi:RHS repeat-associated protein